MRPAAAPTSWTVMGRPWPDAHTPAAADQNSKASAAGSLLLPCRRARLSGPLPVILTQTDRRRDELWWGSPASGLTCPVAWPEPSEHTNCTNSFSESCPWWWW